MVKLNKLFRNVILGLMIGSLSLLMGKSTYTFVCLCSSELSDAFEDIDEHIIDDNLDPIKDNLKESNKKVKENIDALKKNNLLLEKKLKIYTKQYMQLQELLMETKIEQNTLLNTSER